MNTGENYFESQSDRLSALYKALDYMQDNGTDEIDLSDDQDDIEVADLIADLGRMLDRGVVTEHDIREALDDYLSADRRVTYELNLTMGGPNAWVEVVTSGYGHIFHMTYRYAWGNERFERRLSPRSPMGRWAEHETELLMEAG